MKPAREIYEFVSAGDGRFASRPRASEEESPDSIGQEILEKPRIPRTIFLGKDSATEKIPPRTFGVRVKRWGKSPPGSCENRIAG